MRHLAIFVVVVLCGGAAISCADDMDDAESGMADSEGDSCLEGSWSCTLSDGSTAEMTVTGDMIDGSFAMGPVSATVMATLTVDGEMISVVDTGGTGACPSSQVGEYTFSCSADSLDFTLVSDDCMGRMNFFGCEWTR